MKHIIKIIIFALIALGISVGLWMYLNGYLTKSKAAEDEATLTFSNIYVNGMQLGNNTSISAKEGDRVQVDVTLKNKSEISGVDLSFINTGENLEFLYQDSTKIMPEGFDNRVLQETEMMGGTNLKQLKRMMFVATDKTKPLRNSLMFRLYFKVAATGQASITSVIKVDPKASLIVGPINRTFHLAFDPTGFDLTVHIPDARAASAGNLICNTENYNASASRCENVGISLKWTDSANETGYYVYKDGGAAAINTLGAGAFTYYEKDSDASCPPHTYKIIAYNEKGSVSTDMPSVTCSCQKCPTLPTPMPTAIPPINSSDLIFRVVFPNVASTVNEIPDVKVTILNAEGKRLCTGECEKNITFYRVPNARVLNTFRSPQLSYYSLNKNVAYTVVVKQSRTLQQTYKYVFLKWNKVVQCLEGSQESGCGQLLGEVEQRTLLSGDLDGSNTIDQADVDILGKSFGANNTEGDLNFDGATNQTDADILGKNFEKKGT